LALAAGLLVLAVLPWPQTGLQLGEEEGIAQFVGRFPGARSVHVVGSFNDWAPVSIALEERDHDGIWRAAVVLPTGTHEYMFVVDGERWVVDPLAGRFVADDFGRENSLLIVRPVSR
jgi:1,4-alpha-glucan branching enzyme